MVNTQNSATLNEQYNLRWNNYSSNIIKVFSEHLTKETLVDVTLACEGEFIKAHKLVLSACSEYFQNIFQNYNVPHPFILMNNVKLKDLKHIIKFIYCGETKVIESELQDLLDLGEILQIKGLSSLRLKDGSTKTLDEEKSNRNNQADSVKNSSTATSSKMKKRKLSPPSRVDLPKRNENTNNIKAKNPKKKGKVTVNTPLVSPIDLNQFNKNDLNGSKNISPPPSAFMLFANEWREKLAIEHPNETNKEISILLGNKWKGLTPEKKDPYYQAASKANLEHKIKYPKFYEDLKEVPNHTVPSNNINNNNDGNTNEVPIEIVEIVDLEMLDEHEVKIEEGYLEDQLE